MTANLELARMVEHALINLMVLNANASKDMLERNVKKTSMIVNQKLA